MKEHTIWYARDLPDTPYTDQCAIFRKCPPLRGKCFEDGRGMRRTVSESDNPILDVPLEPGQCVKIVYRVEGQA